MKTMLTAAITLLLLVNPSYGSLKRLTEAMVLSKSRRSLLTMITFDDKVCVDFGANVETGAADWLNKYDGNYTYIEMQNDKPAYQMTTCSHPNLPNAEETCYSGNILNANEFNGKYNFNTNTGGDATCMIATDTPYACSEKEWSMSKRHPSISACGNDRTEDDGHHDTTDEPDNDDCGYSEIVFSADNVLGHFNCYRSQIALGLVKGGYEGNGEFLPKAAKMSPLVWDTELASQAEECANHCDYNHCGNNQGLAGWGGTADYNGLVMWWNEGVHHPGFEWGDDQSQTGHWWGIVKQNHVKVGCGIAKCPGFSPENILACNYENEIGAKDIKLDGDDDTIYPYIPSYTTAGSECESGVNSETGLCN